MATRTKTTYKKKKTYEVQVLVTAHYSETVEVKATSEAAAREAAVKKFEKCDILLSECEPTDINYDTDACDEVGVHHG